MLLAVFFALISVFVSNVFSCACGKREETHPAKEPSRDFQSEVTNVHNDYRAKEGQNLRSLTWDETVARTAQNWANQCEFEHSSGYGQNLYIAGIFPLPTDQTATDEQMKRTVVEAVHNWMAEKPYYDYDSNTCAEGKMCGHYTQVVWGNTAKLGCGVAQCDNTAFEGWRSIYVVCEYDPTGNFIGERPY